LILTEELVEALLGALLAVCRVDGDTCPAELASLISVAHELLGSSAFSPARKPVDLSPIWRQLFFSAVTPRILGEVYARARTGGPFRGAAVSSSRHIARAFVRAALTVARADGALGEVEARLIIQFGHALGASARELIELDPWLDVSRLELA
jgi:tellurite resistance protein